MVADRPTGLLRRVRNLERVRQIAEVAVRHGFGYFFERHNLLELVPLRRIRTAAFPEQRGRHIREMLEELGPTFVKFGQLLSTRPDLVPPDIVHELVELQDQVPPISFAAVREVVETELGLSLERLFERFDPEPVASASIGQVHRAVLPGGRNVAVKVQRPTARSQIERDIELFYQIAEVLRDHATIPFVDPVRVVDEFAHSINQEVDYLLEGRHCDRFAANFRDSDEVRIPTVYWRYTTRKVLTLEELHGTTVNSLQFGEMSPEYRRELAETITRAWLKQVLTDGFFHGDPHPGNIIVMGPRQIGLVDFGMAGSLSADDLENAVGLFSAVMDQDVRAVKRRLRRLGLQWSPGKDEGFTRALETVFARYYNAPLGSVDPSLVMREAIDLIYSLHLELPPRFLLLDKTLVTMEAVVEQVYPDSSLFDVARPYARALFLRRYQPQAVFRRLKHDFSTYSEAISEYPMQIHSLLEQARTGELRVKFVHTGLEILVHKLDVLTNRIVIALVAAALAVSSALMAAFISTGPRLLGLSVWSIPGFAAALLFGVWLMWAIVRSGRL